MKYIKNGDRNINEISISFDDGPNPFYTRKILDVLRKFDVKAAFFVIGERCVEYPGILKEIKEEGHLIGNHTFSHKEYGDFKKCDNKIFEILNQKTDFIRPPYFNLSFCKHEKKYISDKNIVTCDVDSKDYLSISEKELISNVVSSVKNGSIIDFHDGSEDNSDLRERAEKTLNSLPVILSYLKSNFNIVRLDKLNFSFSYFNKNDND